MQLPLKIDGKTITYTGTRREPLATAGAQLQNLEIVEIAGRSAATIVESIRVPGPKRLALLRDLFEEKYRGFVIKVKKDGKVYPVTVRPAGS